MKLQHEYQLSLVVGLLTKTPMSEVHLNTVENNAYTEDTVLFYVKLQHEKSLSLGS